MAACQLLHATLAYIIGLTSAVPKLCLLRDGRNRSSCWEPRRGTGRFSDGSPGGLAKSGSCYAESA